jgi:hypothetical protein
MIFFSTMISDITHILNPCILWGVGRGDFGHIYLVDINRMISEPHENTPVPRNVPASMLNSEVLLIYNYLRLKNTPKSSTCAVARKSPAGERSSEVTGEEKQK